MDEKLAFERTMHPDLVPQYQFKQRWLRATLITALVSGILFLIAFFTIRVENSLMILFSPVFWTLIVCLISLVLAAGAFLSVKNIWNGSRSFDQSTESTLEVEIMTLSTDPGIWHIKIVKQPEDIRLKEKWSNFMPLDPTKDSELRVFVQTKPIKVTGRIDRSKKELLSVRSEEIHLCRQF